jgi:hydrogenase maturation protease
MTTRDRRSQLVVVAAVGNPLRGDDGAAWRVAETIERRWASRGVRVLVGQQVVPEWAAVLAEADLVYFLDAAIGRERVGLERLTPPARVDGSAATHSLDPATILNMALELFGRAPEAYVLAIPAAEFGFDEHLSDLTRLAVEKAIRMLDQVLHENSLSLWGAFRAAGGVYPEPTLRGLPILRPDGR